MVELAVIAPVWIALGWGSFWLTELVRVRIELQAAAQAAAWELSGVSAEGGLGAEALRRAEARTVAAWPERADVTNRSVSIQLEPTRLRFGAPAHPPSSGVPPAAQARVGAFLSRGVEGALAAWGLGAPGAVRVEASLDIALPGLSPGFERSLQARGVLWGDDWHLDDGSDVRARREAGGAEPALTRSVRKLVHLGAPPPGADLLPRIRALPFAPSALPSLGGTFVVSHAYRAASLGGASASGCEGTPGYGAATGTESGARDFMEGSERWLDHETPQCFDTAPFRDVHAYPREGGSPGNLSMQLFLERGRYFLGCRQPQARDPSSSRGGADACGAP